MTTPRSVLVLGTGLIGTSIALALRERDVTVWLADRHQASAELAADLGAGTAVPVSGPPTAAEVAVLAVPPAAVASCLAQAQAAGWARWYTDVASVKTLPLRQAGELGCDLSEFVAGHPLSGRERSGPAAARADLFLGRPWVLCPQAGTSAAAVSAVTAVVECCRAEPVTLTPQDHDEWVALVSHAPHLVASAMAARLAEAPPGALGLAGQGLRDVTRIAAGDAGLWTQILAANAAPVAQVIGAVAADLAMAAEALGAQPQAGGQPSGATALKLLTGLLESGGSGVAKIPGKRGKQPRQDTVVQVVIRDQPGELARLFQAAGSAGVNIEDVGIEHSPGLPVGVAELTVQPGSAARLTQALAAAGWPVRR